MPEPVAQTVIDPATALPHVADPGAMITPARTALVVVDVQVDFAAPHGVVAGYGADMTATDKAVDRIEALVAAARAAGVTVAFMRVMTRPESDSRALKTWMGRRGTPGGEAICRVGSGGEAYWRVAPRPGDIEIAKLAYSSFHGTDLDMQLRARDIDTLVMTGLTTDCCVDSTTRDAFHHNYHTFVVSDACAAAGQDLHVHALKALMQHCSLLTTSAAVIGAWTA